MPKTRDRNHAAKGQKLLDGKVGHLCGRKEDRSYVCDGLEEKLPTNFRTAKTATNPKVRDGIKRH